MTPRAVLIALALFALAAPSASGEPSSPAFDRVSIMQETARDGFDVTEEIYLRAASPGDEGAVLALARFYVAHELWPEALAALRRIETAESAESRLLAAECDYRLGRYRRVVARLAGGQLNDPLLAMALTRLGAYADAGAMFRSSTPPQTSRYMRREYFFAMAETLAKTGETEEAGETLARAGKAASDAEESRQRFLIAELRAGRGGARAGSYYKRATSSEINEWSMRARVALAAQDEDLNSLEALSLQWRGGAFERELQLALGRLRLAEGDYNRGFAALRQIINLHAESDSALAAQDAIGATLPQLFAAESSLHPKEAARLFFEHVEFAPPGEGGDILIQQASAKLKALGLYQQAAALLDHQVFKRLRGVARATVAADLADLLLLGNDPADALRVIRSTRLAGLPSGVAQRRRQLEAKSLAATGRGEEALTLLSAAPSTDDLRLRGDIHWSRRAWPQAARDYASCLAAISALDAPAERSLAIRAAAAFLLAGDRAGYRAFAKEAAMRLEGTPEANLLLTMGDVDREQFLANIMNSYQAVYGEKGS